MGRRLGTVLLAWATSIAVALGAFIFPFNNLWAIIVRASGVAGDQMLIEPFVVSAILFVLAALLAWPTRRAFAADRARIVSALQQTLTTPPDPSDVPPFVVYLRPFAADGRISSWARWIGLAIICFFIPFGAAFMALAMMRGIYGLLTRQDLDDFERYVRSSVGGFGPLVAIGRESEITSAGLRLQSSDADWQSLARRLFDNAALILITPAATAGTLWEMRTLLGSHDYRRKTLILFPPKARFVRGVEYQAMYDGWRAALDAVAAEGGPQMSPPSLNKGEIWRLEPDASAPVVYKWNEGVLLNALRAAASDSDARELTLVERDRRWAHAARPIPLIRRIIPALVGLAALAAVPTIYLLGSTLTYYAGPIMEAFRPDYSQYPADPAAPPSWATAQDILWSGGTVTREEAAAAMAEYPTLGWSTIAAETPDALAYFVETSLPETGVTLEMLRRSPFVEELIEHLSAAPTEDLVALETARANLLEYWQGVDAAACAARATGAPMPDTDVVRNAAFDPVLIDLVDRVNERMIIAAWRGRQTPTAVNPASGADWLAPYDAALAAPGMEAVKELIDQGAELADIGPAESCAYHIARLRAAISLPDTAQRARVLAAWWGSGS